MMIDEVVVNIVNTYVSNLRDIITFTIVVHEILLL